VKRLSLSQPAHADRTDLERAPIGIALLGCGTVGGGVADSLLRQSPAIAGLAGRRFALAGIAVRSATKPRSAAIPPWLFTVEAHRLVDDPGVGVVVECIGGLTTAADLVERALRAGKHVVTANKDLLATRGPELRMLATAAGATIAYEAAVGGAIPIVRTLIESLAGESIIEVGGVLNGTTNFILDDMASGRSYDDALLSAQRLGFAEADPSSDTSGLDAAHKLAILSQLAFRNAETTSQIPRTGIEGVTRDDVALGRRVGLALKLVAVARAREAVVTPAYVAREHPFASPAGAHNCIRVVGRSAGTLTFAGAGAGREPTASAVVADVIATLRAMGAGARGRATQDPLAANSIGALPLRTVARLESFRDARPARDALAAAGIGADLLADVPAVVTSAHEPGPAAVMAALRRSGLSPESVIPLWQDLPHPS
jgi:homoserine dehydrogenase